MLIDEAIITVEAGDGGDGRVAFFPNYGKPAGGDGGRGGDLYAVVDSNLSTLTKYTRTHKYHAEDGLVGRSSTKDGKDGESLTLRFPIGTQLIDNVTHESIELQEGAPVLLCKGGQGGWGNASVSRKNQGVFATAYPGRAGQKRNFHVIMRLIADCGLIGIPNAGKSSLLNVLTDAHAKVANYPFTTLEPNLGILKVQSTEYPSTPLRTGAVQNEEKRIILADIPGLIEGASTGKGLGDKFLKHIEKVKVILHCISCETTDLSGDYKKIRKELEEYNPALLAKKEIIILTKMDILCDDTARLKLQQSAEGLASTVVFCSILDDTTISNLTDVIVSSV
jgi:GTP-binding protein